MTVYSRSSSQNTDKSRFKIWKNECIIRFNKQPTYAEDKQPTYAGDPYEAKC